MTKSRDLRNYGTAALVNTQTSSTDTTADALMAVGAFGLGVDFQSDAAGNLDIVGTVGLNAIAKDIAGTAVDIFVYDTRKDSDGGAWRKRTQNTSWYNEASSVTRGSRKEFPAVAVIVAEDTKVTIYDGDDPTMPMWMVFIGGGIIYSNDASSVYMLNGLLCTGNGFATGVQLINFLSDSVKGYRTTSTTTYQGNWNSNIAGRNLSSTNWDGVAFNPTIVNGIVNDVAMTVLPNAPIDPATGLPVPTIAVATDGGVSVIKDDGTVVDITQSSGATYSYSYLVRFKNGLLFFGLDNNGISGGRRYYLRSIPSSDIVLIYNDTSLIVSASETDGVPVPLSTGRFKLYDEVGIGSNSGLTFLDENLTTPSKGSVAYITSDYNTGWMNGDIKLAALSDTDTTTPGQEIDHSGITYRDSGRILSHTYVTGAKSWSVVDDTTNPNASYFGLTIPVEDGVSYTIYHTKDQAFTSGASQSHIEFVDSDNTLIYWGSGADLSDVVTFTAKGTFIRYVVYSENDVTTNHTINVKYAEPDRSVNGNGLQVLGTVTKTPVATGADLVGYSGWSSSNYLEQPYNSDLDFGTGDFCYQWWLKTTDKTNYPYVVSRSNASGSDGVRIYIMPSGTVRFVIISGLVESIADVATGFWNHICVKRVNGTVEIFINGTLNASGSLTNTVNSTVGALRVGSFSGDNAMDGSIALLRISATAPSAEQIAKIYEDEKVLFQENAKATLYGTSNAVTALAYDDDTELLHVGTSAGRSIFQGLQRMDNTTDAVGVAISASNGLVAED